MDIPISFKMISSSLMGGYIYFCLFTGLKAGSECHSVSIERKATVKDIKDERLEGSKQKVTSVIISFK